MVCEKGEICTELQGILSENLIHQFDQLFETEKRIKKKKDRLEKKIVSTEIFINKQNMKCANRNKGKFIITEKNQL